MRIAIDQSLFFIQANIHTKNLGISGAASKINITVSTIKQIDDVLAYRSNIGKLHYTLLAQLYKVVSCPFLANKIKPLTILTILH